METYLIQIADLLLDVKNPRHDPVETQEEQIAALVKDDQVKSLASDIAVNGLSPIEKPIVMYDENSEKYIVLEGNRRVCSLILLHNPMLAPISIRPVLTQINKDKVPDSIECALAKSREEARVWIDRRHSGLSGGIGLKSWNSIQKTRASDIFEKPNDNSLSLALFEYAKKYLRLDCSEKKASLTTASRYLGNNKFRNTMGIRSRRPNKRVRIACSHLEFESILYRFLSDLIDNDQSKEFGVHSRTKKLDIENYANHLISENLAPKITEKESFLEPRPKGIPTWNSGSTPSASGGHSATSERDDSDNALPITADQTQPPSHADTTNSDSSLAADSFGNPSIKQSDSEQSNGENYVDPSDLSDLDLSHTRQSRIPPSKEIINRLNALADPKLSSLYKSICTVSLNKHPSLMYSGVWMFFEALAQQYGGSKYNQGLEAYLNQIINDLFPKIERMDLKNASHNLAQFVNSVKHSGKYYVDSANQLAIDFATIEPLTIKMLDKLASNKNDA
ncbi:hypothetical protein [Bermanella sp. R86510]|uniref:hypothetical protein n=1 Tax=unclassified Bermanella TaxID=2627862 RepID=UPI0037C784AD